LVAHNLKGDTPFPGGLNPSYLIDRVSRLGPGITGLYNQLTNVGTIAVAVPIAIAVILMRLRRAQRTLLVWFYLLAGLFYFAVLVWAYWVNPIQIQFLVMTSADRVYMGLAFIALMGVLHLAELAPMRSAAQPVSSGADAGNSYP
jgi:TRAP-type C4-dicarboxylate transport system permease small subunit